MRRRLVARCRRCHLLTQDWFEVGNGERVCAKCVHDAVLR
jgi:formylmethanofuran dehydrogenase subunit E